jgi:hypothetical protein
LALIAAAALPATATAGTAHARPRSIDRLVDFEMKFDGTNGYTIHFSGQRYNGKSAAGFFVTGNRSYAYYERLAEEVSARRIKADFGRLGRVSISFERTGPSRHVNVAGCKGYEAVRRGVFRGRVSFAGEHGYTQGAEQAIRGKISVPHIKRCRPSRISGPERKRAVILGSCGLTRGASFLAYKRKPGYRSAFGVFSDESTKRMYVLKAMGTRARSAAFSHSQDLSTADLSPHGPFTGSAAFADDALTGDLVASLPGSKVRLTPARAAIAHGTSVDAGRCVFIAFGRAVADRVASGAPSPRILRRLPSPRALGNPPLPIP